MTDSEKALAFAGIGRLFEGKRPVLPNDFREWGIETYADARALLAEFGEAEMAGGVRWLVEEKPYKCRVIDPATGDESDGEVTAFWGAADVGWSRRRHDA